MAFDLWWLQQTISGFDGVTAANVEAAWYAGAAVERKRWAQAAAVAVQELAGCATWTQGGVTCQALRDLLDKA